MTDNTLTTKEAIAFVSEHFGHKSLYSISKALSDETLTVQPTQIKRYVNGARMSRKVADRFLEVYDIVVSDVWSPGYFMGDSNGKMDR